MDRIGSFVHGTLCAPCAQNPKRAITYAWFSSILLVFIVMISACVVADRHKIGGSRSLGFAAVWTALMVVGVSVFGTIVMRKYQSPFAIGIFLGVVVVAANQCLILTAIFGAESKSQDKGHKKESDDIFATFAFFLFCIYIFFATLLAVFRNDLIKDQPAVPEKTVELKAPVEEQPAAVEEKA